MSMIGVIIPTFNNPQYLNPCVNSLLNPLITEDLLHLYIVNNGEPETMKGLEHPRVTVLQQTENKGWEGGLKAGLEVSKEEFVVFMNDDTYVPLSSIRWANQLINHFADPKVGAVGPASNVVMGIQNIFAQHSNDVIRVNFLIGFCVMLRRSALNEVGGVEDTLPGGDDFDLSIRMRQAGYELRADRNVFIYHHGFKTGERVNGGPNEVGGWNSVQMMENTNFGLIRKHGLRAFLECLNQVPSQMTDAIFDPLKGWREDTEGDVVRGNAIGDKILELGCGARKTFVNSVGIDIVPLGEMIPGVSPHLRSLADITGDAQNELPVKKGIFDTVIARHILEHMTDTVKAVESWGQALRDGGRLIIAVPNQAFRNTIPMNMQHVHAWTPESLKRFMESQGWKTVAMIDPKNYVSVIGVFEKDGVV